MPTDTKSELAAILTGAAIFPFDDRAFLRITGSDATRWLNGMVTNSIQALAPGEGNYNFLLNAQGRIQGDCMIYREPEQGEATYLLQTDQSQIDKIRTLLDKFIIMDDVELSEIRDGSASLLVVGTQASSTLGTIGLSAVPSNRYVIADSYEGPVAVLTTESNNRLLLVAEEDQIDAIREKLALPELSSETLEAFRILSGRPRFGQDIRDKDLPQETAQEHALHFSKGCYLGQEIVERIRSRGQVHRTFSGFHLTALPASLPAPLISDGKAAGELTSAITIGDQTFALGYVRREALDRNQPLDFEGGTATPAALPFQMTPS